MSGSPIPERLPAALHELVTAASNARYYGPGHPYVAEYIRAAQAAIAALLESVPSVTIFVIAGRLVVDGHPYPHPPAHVLRFAEMLRERGLESVSFHRGVTPEEVTGLVTSLGGKIESNMPPTQGIRLGRVVLKEDEAPAAAAGSADADRLIEIAQSLEGLGDAELDRIRELYEMAERRKRLDVRAVDQIVRRFISVLLADFNPVTLLATVKGAHEYTFTHAVNVGILTIVQAKAVGFTGAVLHAIGVASMLHDVGKIFIPEEILSKPRELTPAERTIIETHTIKGGRYLMDQAGIPEIAVVAAFEHHRKFDGTGYPVNRPGWRPNLISQMVAISDVFDALRSDRVYRHSQPQEEIVRIFTRDQGAEFNPRLVASFLALIGRPVPKSD
jgi:HD-GYP domain-containing protein (c-di-GMP phosphodiesterase class II)